MITLEHIKAALTLASFDAESAHFLMAPLAGRTDRAARPAEMEGEARIGSVLLLLYCHQKELYLVLTRRRDDLNSHAGQISFPGGRKDEGETAVEAALRETHEEVGVDPTAVSIIGQLATIWIPPSDFFVHPFVGWIANGERPVFIPSESEVDQILEVSVRHLLDPQTKKTGIIKRENFQFEVPYFDVDGRMVWGATAVMLSEFVERLRAVLG